MKNKTIYPHPYEIQRVSPFPVDANGETKSKSVAGVLLRYGPISFRARLVQGEKGLFLSMPARKNETTGEYWDHVFITDRGLSENLQSMAIEEYYKVTGEVVEVAA